MTSHPSSIEPLESRIAPAAFIVTSLTDEMDGGTLLNHNGADGKLSLREAIALADLSSGSDTITFKTGLAGTMVLGSELFIDGSAHPGDKLTITGPGSNKIIIDANN